MKLYLVRHAEIEQKYQGKFIGQLDVDLSPKGEEQAKKLGEWFLDKQVDAVYTSPLQRAVKTAAAIAHSYKVMDALQEISFGDYEGKAKEALATIPPGGELYKDFSKRVVDTLLAIEKKHVQESALIVAHAGVLREILKYYLHPPDSIYIAQAFACINILRIADVVAVEGINITL
jgi:broad specificity phosphatase PhoE